MDRTPLFTSLCPTRVGGDMGGANKKRGVGFLSLLALRAGLPRGPARRAISSVVERAPDNCVVVPGL